MPSLRRRPMAPAQSLLASVFESASFIHAGWHPKPIIFNTSLSDSWYTARSKVNAVESNWAYSRPPQLKKCNTLIVGLQSSPFHSEDNKTDEKLKVRLDDPRGLFRPKWFWSCDCTSLLKAALGTRDIPALGSFLFFEMDTAQLLSFKQQLDS